MARTRILHGMALVLACSAAPAAAAEDAKAQAPTLLHLQLRTQVDADGHAVAAADDTVPAPLRAVVERQIAAWRFMPARSDGAPVAATTWVSVAACLVPDGDNYRISIGYERNGPWQPPSVNFSPSMPPAALLRAGINTELQVDYTVQPNGRGSFTAVAFADDVPAQFRPWYTAAMRMWVKAQRFQPEQVEGRPVATRMRVPVSMDLAPLAGHRAQARQRADAWREQQRLREQLSPACIAAGDDGSARLGVALDSPVRLHADPLGGG